MTESTTNKKWKRHHKIEFFLENLGLDCMFDEGIENIDYVISEQEVCHGDSMTEKELFS